MQTSEISQRLVSLKFDAEKLHKRALRGSGIDSAVEAIHGQIETTYREIENAQELAPWKEECSKELLLISELVERVVNMQAIPSGPRVRKPSDSSLERR